MHMCWLTQKWHPLISTESSLLCWTTKLCHHKTRRPRLNYRTERTYHAALFACCSACGAAACDCAFLRHWYSSDMSFKGLLSKDWMC